MADKLSTEDQNFYTNVIVGLLVAQYIYASTPMNLGTSETYKMFNDAAAFTDQFQNLLKKNYGMEKISIDTELVNDRWHEIRKILRIRK